MRWSLVFGSMVIVTATTGHAVAAQEGDVDINAAAAYFAITTTTVGATTMHGPTLFGPPVGRRLRAQFGHADEEGPFAHRTLLLGLEYPAGSGATALEVGIVDHTCDEDELVDELGVDVSCGALFTVGGRWTGRLLSSAIGEENAAELRVGVEAALGGSFGGEYLEFSDATESLTISARNLAASVSLPIGLVAPIGQGGTTIAPMIAPGFAYGRSTLEVEFEGTDDDVTESGARFMLAAGVGIVFGSSGFGVDAGVRKVFAEDAPVVIGLGASIRIP